jgi:hypothetical protein
MISLLAIAVTVFLVYYQVVVRREESHLARQHGESFTRYAATTPRWVPNLSRWHDAPRLEIEPRRILSHFVDSGLFFLSFIFFEFLEALRSSGLAVILLTLP